MSKHISVLLDESISNLNIKEDGIYVDCTLGYAGHSSQILKRITRGSLFAFDQDMEAINYSKKVLDQINNNYEIIYSNFVNIKEELLKRNITKVDGILFDLGVSSPQLDEDDRGFSFHKDAVLDMRMNKNQKLSAKDVVNTYSEEKLTKIFYEYGEEKYAKSIAKNIVKKRKEKEINTTLELVDIIKDSVPMKYKLSHHPARKVFQAIRIEVNDELNVLKSALVDAIDLLKPNGRLCVITFQSLEDRIVKNTFKKYSEVNKIYKGLPYIPPEYRPKIKIIGKFKPTDEEINNNKRSRSAILRVIERE